MIKTYSQKTSLPTKGTIKREWHLIDAKDQVLGRLSTCIANLLTGKRKPFYTHAVDCGDFVIVVNADKVHLSGAKIEKKHIFHHTAHPGGGRVTLMKIMIAEKPIQLLERSVKKMLPKNKLASRQILRLKAYRGDTHPHSVQQPKKLELSKFF